MPFYTNQSRHHRRGRSDRHKSTRSLVFEMKRKMPEPEVKWFDYINSVATGSGVVGTTPFIFQLDAIAQGDGQNERIGDSIKQSSMFVNYTLLAEPDSNATVRIMHFIWKAPGVPTTAQILQNDTTQPVISPLNRDYATNIRVIKDRTYALGTGESQLQVEKFYKKMYAVTKYTADNATTTSDNGLYMLYVSDNGTDSPRINYYHRLNYKDM